MEKKKDHSTLLVIVCLAIIAAFWLLPGGGAITSVGMKVIGVFIATVILLSFVNPVWPAFLAVALLSRTGVASLAQITQGSIGNWIFYFILMSFIMTHALNESGFTKRVVGKFLSMPFARKSPWGFTIALAIASMLIGAFIDQCPAIAFVLSFANQLYKELGYEKDDYYPHMTNFLVAYSVIIGGAMTPISHSFALLGMGIYEGATGNSISLAQYMAFGVPTGLVLFALLLLIVRFFCHPDFSNFETFDVNKVLTQGKMSKKEKFVVTVFFAAVVMWMLPGVAGLFTSVAWVSAVNNYGITFWAILAVVLFAVIHIDGKPVLNVAEVVSKKTDWGILIFVSIAIYLGSALSNDATGINAAITGLITPLTAKVAPVVVALIISIAGVFVTNFASNVTTITVMTGVGVAVAMASNGAINPAGIALCATMAGSCAYLLPSSFAGIALLHGNEYSDRATILKYGAIMMCLSSVAIGLVGYVVGCAITG